MTRRAELVALFGCLAFSIPSLSSAATARDVRYLDALPEPAQVLRDYTDRDPEKAFAMQYSAMVALNRAIEARLARLRREQPNEANSPATLAERTRSGAYSTAIAQLQAERDKRCQARGCDAGRYKELMARYGNDTFHRSVVEKYLTGSLLEEHDRVIAEDRRLLTAHAQASVREGREKRRKEAERTGTPRPWSEILADWKARTPGFWEWLLSGLTQGAPSVRWAALGILLLVVTVPVLGVAAIFHSRPRRMFAGILGVLGRILGGGWLITELASCGLWTMEAFRLHPALVALAFISAIIALAAGPRSSTDLALEQKNNRYLYEALASFVFGALAWILTGLASLV